MFHKLQTDIFIKETSKFQNKTRDMASLAAVIYTEKAESITTVPKGCSSMHYNSTYQDYLEIAMRSTFTLNKLISAELQIKKYILHYSIRKHRKW
uniref:Uncharacterized protein n=1 Tax=Setaria italica TaxID=4555 RepID=K4AH61_SETIT